MVPDQGGGVILDVTPSLAESELRYRSRFLRQDARSVVFLSAVVLFFQVVLIKADAVLGLTPLVFQGLLALRSGLVLLSMAAIVICSRTDNPGRFDRMCFVWGMVMALTNNLVILTRPPAYIGNMNVELVVICALYTILPDRTIYRTLPPVLGSAGSLFLFFTVKTPVGMVATLSIVFAYVSANLLGFYFSIKSYRYRRSSFFTAEALERALQEADASRQIIESSNRQLFEIKEQYRQLVQNSHEVIYEIGPDGMFRFVSPGWTRLLGHDVSDVENQDFRQFVHVEDIPACEAFLEKTVSMGEAQQGVEYRVFHKDGSIRWHRSNILPCFNDRHDIVMMVGNAVDITDYKENQTQLELARMAAEASNTAKTEFLALVSHEIRTPLNAVVGFSRLVRQANGSDRCTQYFGIIEESSRILMNVVNNILDMSRIESGQLTLESAPFNLSELIGRIESLYAPLAAERGLDFEIVVTGDIPEHVVGDALRLQQILSNLLSNAIKFTESGRVQCQFDTVPGDSHGSDSGQFTISITVRDSGIGIAESKQALLFRPFQQLDPSITRRYGGSGLGLAIVNRMVKLMGGQISVISQEGSGTRFVVTLPLRVCTDAISPSKPILTIAPLNILIVEDNAFNRLLLTDTLTGWGHAVMSAENARDALTLKQYNPFDLVILDIRMPDMDGIELAVHLRRMESERSVPTMPIIALTADISENTRQRCLEAGINSVLCKPLDPMMLASALAEYGASGSFQGDDAQRYILSAATMADLAVDADRLDVYQNMLVKDIAEELDRLDQAVCRGDRPEVEDATHTMKGLCGHLRLPQPRMQAAWLNRYAATASIQELKDAADSLRAACSVFLQAKPLLEETP